MPEIFNIDPITAYTLLFTTGLLAGVTNAIAGGGTFFTFPVLLWVGVPPIVANTTNMVALLPANLAALPAFREQLITLGKECLPPIVFGVIGGSLGAVLLLWLGGGIFAALVPYLIGIATLLFATAPSIRRLVFGMKTRAVTGWSVGTITMLLGFSIYGGYFGAGLGQIMLAALILAGFDDLSEANALKNAVVFAVSLIAVLIFALGGTVHWPYALTMMISSTIGGYFGGRLSLVLPQQALRVCIICFGIFLTTYYLSVGA